MATPSRCVNLIVCRFDSVKFRSTRVADYRAGPLWTTVRGKISLSTQAHLLQPLSVSGDTPTIAHVRRPLHRSTALKGTQRCLTCQPAPVDLPEEGWARAALYSSPSPRRPP